MIILSIIRDEVLDTIEVFNCYWDAKDFTHEYLKLANLPKTAFNERFAPKMNGRVFVDVPGLFISAVERTVLAGNVAMSELAYQAYEKVVTFDVLRTLTVTPPQMGVTPATFTPKDSSYVNSAYDLPMGWDNSGKPVRYSQWINDVFNIKTLVSLTPSEQKALILARIKQTPSFNAICPDLRRTFNQAEALNHIEQDTVEGKEVVNLEIEALTAFIDSKWDEAYDTGSSSDDDSDYYNSDYS